MKLVVVTLLTVAHLVSCSHPHTIDECIVKGDDGDGVKFSTYKDSVEFYLASFSEDQDVKLQVKQEATTSASVRNIPSLTWMKVLLNMTLEPQLLVNDVTTSFTQGEVRLVSGAPKWVTISNAYVLRECPQGLPTLVLGSTKNIDVPSSADEERLILIPTQDTKVALEVSGQGALLCLNNGTRQPVFLLDDDEQEEGQHIPLEKDTPIYLTVTYNDADVTLKVWSDDETMAFVRTTQRNEKRLKFIRDDVKGLVSIVQCMECLTQGTQASSATLHPLQKGEVSLVPAGTNEGSKDGDEDDNNMTWMIYKVIIPSILLTALLIQSVLVVHLCHQLRCERRLSYKPHKEFSDPGSQQENPSTSSSVVYSANETTGVVDTLNDLYVSSDELGLQANGTYPNTHLQENHQRV